MTVTMVADLDHFGADLVRKFFPLTNHLHLWYHHRAGYSQYDFLLTAIRFIQANIAPADTLPLPIILDPDTSLKIHVQKTTVDKKTRLDGKKTKKEKYFPQAVSLLMKDTACTGKILQQQILKG
jgi:hypothetical protein